MTGRLWHRWSFFIRSSLFWFCLYFVFHLTLCSLLNTFAIFFILSFIDMSRARHGCGATLSKINVQISSIEHQQIHSCFYFLTLCPVFYLGICVFNFFFSPIQNTHRQLEMLKIVPSIETVTIIHRVANSSHCDVTIFVCRTHKRIFTRTRTPKTILWNFRRAKLCKIDKNT